MAAVEIPVNDPVIAAIPDELAVAVEANVEDERALPRNLRRMRARGARGGAGSREPGTQTTNPSTLSLIGQVMVRFREGERRPAQVTGARPLAVRESP